MIVINWRRYLQICIVPALYFFIIGCPACLSFATEQAVIIRLTAGLTFILCVLFISINSGKALYFNKEEILFFLLLLIIVLFTVLSPYKSVTIRYAAGLVFGVFILLKFLSFRIHTIKGLSLALAGIGICEGIYGVVHYKMHATGITGHFDNPAGFAVTLVVLCPFAVSLIEKRSVGLKITGSFAVVLFLTGILLSESRAGIIALLFMGVFYLFWYLKAKTRKISFQKKPVLLFTAGTLFLGLLTVLYKVKRGSANGRLLIWISSWKMVLDKPILGHRTNSFAANYMLYQADYFANNPDSRFSELADNIIHPFNEYLSCLIQYGAVGFILFVLFLVYIVRQGLKWALKEKLPALISLLGLGIFGLFSYPMYYALILIIVSVNLYIISCSPRKNHSYGLPTLLLLPVVVPLTCFAVSGSIKTVRSEKKWEQLRNAVTLSANAGDILAGYATLRSQYADNPLFLYNYGAVLNGYGCYEKSIRIFKECERFLNNCELQSYLADNYMKTNEYARAESCAILASRMCPSRFMPLYQLVLVYDQTNRTGKAVELAKEVIVRPVKVWNPNSYLIKVKLQEFIKSKEPGGTFVGKAYN